MPSIIKTINENAYGTIYSWATPHPLPSWPGTDTVFTISFNIPNDLPASHPNLRLVSASLGFLPIAPNATVSGIPWAEHWEMYYSYDLPEGNGNYDYPYGWLNDRADANLVTGTIFGNFLAQVQAAELNPAGGTVSINCRVNNRGGIIYPTSSSDPSYPIAPENPSQICNFVLNYAWAWDGPTSALGQPFNLQDEMGRYHSTNGGGGLVEYRRSDYGTNSVQGWGAISSILAPAGRTLHNPRVIVDDRQTVRLAYAQQKTSDSSWDGVYLADSNDDGKTWEDSVLMIEDGKHPTIAIGNDGTFNTVVLAAYVGPDGGPGVITAVTKSVGDEDFSDPFNFKDENGDDLVAGDDTFHIAQARDDQSRWMLHALIYSASGTDQYSSYDEARTWQKVV